MPNVHDKFQLFHTTHGIYIAIVHPKNVKNTDREEKLA